MDDVRGDILGPPHGTTPAAVIAYKMKLRSFRSSEHISELKGSAIQRFRLLKPTISYLGELI